MYKKGRNKFFSKGKKMSAIKKNTPSSIDLHIGRRMQLRRTMLGLSQKALAEKCGVTFQQIQKYEAADNRISASRLFEVGRALDTPMSFFFLGLPGNMPEETKANKSIHVSEPHAEDPLGKNETLKLIQLYWHLPESHRKTVMNLLTALTGATVENTETQN